MTEIKDVTQAKDYVIEHLDRLKNNISAINAVAVKFGLFPDMLTKILDLSCLCDDLIGELVEAGSGT